MDANLGLIGRIRSNFRVLSDATNLVMTDGAVRRAHDELLKCFSAPLAQL